MVTSASDSERAIFLLPIEGAESVPLRRGLGREAWRRNPVVSLHHEPDSDRIMFRITGTPSAAWGVVDAPHPPELDDELFIGFDGTDRGAWPTTITVLGFLRHRDRGAQPLEVVREMVGAKVWEAALSLRTTVATRRDVGLSEEEASGLIRRWSELVISPVYEAADAALADWSAKAADQAKNEAADHPASDGQAVDQAYLPALAAAYPVAPSGPAGHMSRPAESGRTSVEGGADAGWPAATSEAIRVGAVMARRSPKNPDDPPGPLRYGLMARLADIWAARRDGNAGVPPLPDSGPPADDADKRHGITPYLEIRNRHFLDWAERERRRMLTDLEETSQMRAEVRQKIISADQKAAAIQKLLESIPSAPSDLTRRNLLEQHVHESLIKARRQREFDAQRTKMAALSQQATDAACDLRAQEARLSETIATREEMLNSQVRQLLQHSLRRCGTYMRHIVHHHPDGNAVIPYLKLALPDMPDWQQQPAASTAQVNGQAVPHPPADTLQVNGQAGRAGKAN